VTGGTLVVLHGASSVGKITTLEALPPWRGPVCLPTGLDHMLVRAQPFVPQLGRSSIASVGVCASSPVV